MARLFVLTALLLGVSATHSVAATRSPAYVGSWSDRLSRAQMYDQGLDARLAGTFQLVLRRNGTYTTFNSFDKSSRGRFYVHGNRIVFFDDVGCKAGGFEGKAAYTWSITRGRLRLSTVRVGGDVCGGRWQTLTYPLWKRV